MKTAYPAAVAITCAAFGKLWHHLAVADPVDALTRIYQIIIALSALAIVVERIINKLRNNPAAGQGGNPEATTRPTQSAAPPPRNGGGIAPVIAAVLLALPLVCGGCSTTPAARVLIAQDTYTATLKELTTARRQGLITDSEAIQLEKYRGDAAALLDTIKTDILRGDSVGAASWDALTAALSRFTVEYSAAKKVKRNDPTGSSGTSGGWNSGSIGAGAAGQQAAYRATRPDAGRMGSGRRWPARGGNRLDVDVTVTDVVDNRGAAARCADDDAVRRPGKARDDRHGDVSYLRPGKAGRISPDGQRHDGLYGLCAGNSPNLNTHLFA